MAQNLIHVPKAGIGFYPVMTLMLGLTLATTGARSQGEPALLPPDHPSVRAVAGGWDVEAASGRKCRMQLNPQGTRADLVVGMPAPCKMSIPSLGPAALWALRSDGQVLLRANDGKTLGAFARDGTGPMKGRMGAEPLTLTPATGRYPDMVKQAAIVTATSASKPVTPNPLAPRASLATLQPPAASDMPGIYVMMRQQGREACRLILDAKPAKKPGQNLARFQGTCSDAGLMIFDPVAWRISDGRLFLVAKKGHETGFSHGADGTWRKDPPSGAPLMLAKAN